MEHLLKVKQVAEIMGVKEKTIYQWCELDKMPHIKLGSALRFRPEQIDAFILNNQRGNF